MRTLIVLVVLAALGGGGYYFFFLRDAKAAAAAVETTPAKVVRGTILQSVAATGRVVSNLDVDIKCKASGEIIELPKDVSDRVKKDELLVRLDPVDETRAVKKAEVALAQSKAKLAQATENVKIAEQNLLTTEKRIAASLRYARSKLADVERRAARRKELLDKNLGTQEEYDTARTAEIQATSELETLEIQQEELKQQAIALEVKKQEVKLAEAQVADIQITLDNANQRFRETQVAAPMDGVVAVRNVQKGQIISSGITNVGGGTTVLTLSDLSHIFVLAAVDESDIGVVKEKQPVRITVDAHRGETFLGEVKRIATRGVNTSNVVTFEVKIEVTSENKALLKPEMTANVQIVQAERKNVLLAPSQAITRNKDGKLVVTVPGPEGTAGVERPVRVGLNDGTRWEIVEGLKEDESVLVKKGEADSRWRADSSRPRMGPMMMGGGRPR